MNINTAQFTTTTDVPSAAQIQHTTQSPEIQQLQKVIEQVEAQKAEASKKRQGEELEETSDTKKMRTLPLHLLPQNTQTTTTVSNPYFASSSSRTPPPLKRKLYSPRYTHTAQPEISPFKKLYLDSLNRTITLHGKEFFLKKFTMRSDANDHKSRSDMDTFLLCKIPDQPHLTPSGHNIVAKIFNENICNYKPELLSSYLQKSLQNYRDAQEYKMPVAFILNENDVKTDNCLLQEFIPDAVNPLNKQQMKQVETLFKITLQKGKVFNLLPNALRMNKLGTVVLTDFIYDSSDGTAITVMHAIEQWARLIYQRHNHDEKKTEQFVSDFTKELVPFGYELEWNQLILKNIFYMKAFGNIYG